MKSILTRLVLILLTIRLPISGIPKFRISDMVYEQRYVQRILVDQLFQAFTEKQANFKTFSEEKMEIVDDSISCIYPCKGLYRFDREMIIDETTRIIKGIEFRTEDFIGKIIDKYGNNAGYAYLASTYYPSDGGRYFYPSIVLNEDWSYSYADHAERIRLILGLDEVIPPTDVRLVRMSELGDLFYINHDGIEGFVAAVPLNKDKFTQYDVLYNKFIGMDFIEKIAEMEHEKYVKHIEHEKKAYPNKTEYGTGYMFSVYSSLLMESGDLGDPDLPINNIVNCYEYFGLDPTVYYAEPWECAVACTGSAAVIATSFIVVRGVKKKQKVRNPEISDGE